MMNNETLQDRMFDAIISFEKEGHVHVDYAATACAEIAKNEAIEFAEWCIRSRWEYWGPEDDLRWYSDESGIMKTGADLYSLFKQKER